MSRASQSSADPRDLTATGLLHVIARQQRELAELRARSAADALIDMAVGVLAERLRCSVTEAGDQLRRLASASGVTPDEFAAEVLGGTTRTLHRPPLDDGARRRLWLAEAAVSHATDGCPVAEAVFTEVLAHQGAVAVAFWMLESDGALTLVGETGLGPLEASRWQRIPPQLDCVAMRAARGATPQWWPEGSPPEANDPTDVPTDVPSDVPAGGRAGVGSVPRVGPWLGARAALPFLQAGAVVGAMEICWPAPLAEFTAGLRRELVALADLCLRGLHPGGFSADTRSAQPQTLGGRTAWLPALLDAVAGSVLLAHAVRAEDGEILDFHVDHVNEGFVDPAGRHPAQLRGRRLLDLYPLMAADAGLLERAVAVVRTGEQYQADGIALLVLVDDVLVAEELDVRIAPFLDGVVISWRPVGGGGAGGSLAGHLQRLGRFGGWQEDVRTGAVRWTDHVYELFQRDRTMSPVPLDDLDPHIHPDDRAAVDHLRDALLRLGRAASGSFRVIGSDGTLRQLRAFAEPVTDAAGVTVAVRGIYQDLTSHYRTQVVLDATRDQLADSEARADGQHQLALALQRAILPSSEEPVDLGGLAVAVRYRPAEQEHLVGGDWYDAVTLPTGEVLLVVGDVAGHSIRTVAGMVTLRNSLRGLAVTGAGPGQLLRWLNNVTYHLADNITATVICGLYRPAERALRWARAGHLPPVLVRDGSAHALPMPDGLLLGVEPDVDYQETVHVLEPDDVLLLFTDGLIERRGTGLDESLHALLRIAAAPGFDVSHRADHLLAHTTPDTDDDTCLIVIRQT